MPTNPQATYEAIVNEMTATSPTLTGKTFGMPCLKHDGKVFAGYYENAMVFKLRTPEHTEALALQGAHLFDPTGQGRPMKEWVVVPFEHAPHWIDFARAAFDYVGELR